MISPFYIPSPIEYENADSDTLKGFIEALESQKAELEESVENIEAEIHTANHVLENKQTGEKDGE